MQNLLKSLFDRKSPRWRRYLLFSLLTSILLLLFSSFIIYWFFNDEGRLLIHSTDTLWFIFSIFIQVLSSTIILIIGLSIFQFSKSFFGAGADILDRNLSSRIELSESRIRDDIDTRIRQQISSLLEGNELRDNDPIGRAIADRIDEDLLVRLDEALARRVQTEASDIRRWRTFADVFERIRIKLDGPASRAESSAFIFRRLAAALAAFGVVVAIVRVFWFGSGVTPLMLQTLTNGSHSLWSMAIINGAPWIGLILLIEFTALLYFRFYARGVETQRYFTKELAGLEVRLAAMRVVLDTGTKEQIMQATRILMTLDSNVMSVERVEEQLSMANNVVKEVAASAKSIKDAVAKG
jgi:hypothetical protein